MEENTPRLTRQLKLESFSFGLVDHTFEENPSGPPPVRQCYQRTRVKGYHRKCRCRVPWKGSLFASSRSLMIRQGYHETSHSLWCSFKEERSVPERLCLCWTVLSLSPLMMDIMMRFRCFTFPNVGDIEKAFLMVGVDAVDPDALRFLWVQDPFAN